MEQEKNKLNKKMLYIICGIIILILAIIITCIIINANNNKKYLEVAKRTLPQVEEIYLDTQKIHTDMLEDIIEYRSYLSEETAINKVKSTSAYKGFVTAIDKNMSELYKDLEYLKNHTYSKNIELSVQIENIIIEFEEKMSQYREIESHYEYEEKSFFERIREIQNSLNRE